jgi:UPF0755 protein
MKVHVPHHARHDRHVRTTRHSALVWLLLALVVGGAAGLGLVGLLVKSPYKGYAAESVLVEIPPRSSSISVLTALEEGGVIRDRRLGLFTLKVLHRGRTLKAGEYRFRGARTLEQVLLTIASGDVVTYRITIPEGFLADDVFALLASQGFGTEAGYHALFHSTKELDGVPAEAPSLEGFLFPDTYTITRSMGPREILGLMTRQFARRCPRPPQGMSILSLTSLASLVEKETAVPAERTVVAAVYRNRLRRGMLLQCDPTTIYSLKRLGTWRGTLARSELQVDDAYNTYVRAGLPPGPICNPGLASLRAAAEPADVPYLYFVAAGDGSHTFTTDYDEQQRNAKAFHLARRAARDAEGSPR